MRHYENDSAGFRHFEEGELLAVVPWASLDDYRQTCPDAPDQPTEGEHHDEA